MEAGSSRMIMRGEKGIVLGATCSFDSESFPQIPVRVICALAAIPSYVAAYALVRFDLPIVVVVQLYTNI